MMAARRRKKQPPRKRGLVIDVRDQRLPDGRLTISARTKDPSVFQLRRAAVYTLMEMGELGGNILERLKDKRLRIERVAEMVHARRAGELLEQAKAEERPVPAKQMLGATIDRFLTRVKATLAPATLVEYRGFCRGLETALGVVRDSKGRPMLDVAVSDVQREAAEAWLYGPKGKARKPWSARRQTLAHATVHQVWQLAIAADEERAERDGLPRTLTRNIFAAGPASIRPPKIRKTRVVFLSRSQAGRLLWAVRGRPAAILMAAGIYAGLRAGETVHLRDGIDVLEDQLKIQPRDGKYAWRPKTDNSVREVPMHPRLARWIRAHRRSGYAGEVYLTRPSTEDKPISDKTRERWVVEAFERAGIEYGRDEGEGATLHTLRHTTASWLTMADVHPLKIAKILGDDVKTVMDTYAHLVSHDLQAAIRRLT